VYVIVLLLKYLSMIKHQVLGVPGRDNAVRVVVDSGQSFTRLLFDCGYGCLDALSIANIMAIDAVFFSHYHMEHIAGFDLLFRCNCDRGERARLQVVQKVTGDVIYATHELTVRAIERDHGCISAGYVVRGLATELSKLKRIDGGNTGFLEVSYVSGSDSQTVLNGGGGDQAILDWHSFSFPSEIGKERGPVPGGAHVDGNAI
jgi:hypothetical protein